MPPRPRTPRLTLLSVAMTLGLASRAAHACDCARPPPPAEALAGADAVFEGEAGEPRGPARDASGRLELLRRVPMRVLRAWKGVAPGESVTLVTGLGGGDCGFAFRAGVRYLVYATRAGGALATDICTRTAPSAEAALDLAALGRPRGDDAGAPAADAGASRPPTARGAAETVRARGAGVDAHPPGVPPRRGGCTGCAVGREAAPRAWGAVVAVALLARGRRARARRARARGR